MKAQLQSEFTEEVNSVTEKYLDWTHEGGFLNSDSTVVLFYFSTTWILFSPYFQQQKWEQTEVDSRPANLEESTTSSGKCSAQV